MRADSVAIKIVDSELHAFGITGTDWAEIPPDRGTAQVLRGGVSILLDRDGLVAEVVRAVA